MFFFLPIIFYSYPILVLFSTPCFRYFFLFFINFYFHYSFTFIYSPPPTLCKGGLAHHNNPIHWVKSSIFLSTVKNYLSLKITLNSLSCGLVTRLWLPIIQQYIFKVKSQIEVITISNTKRTLITIS